MNDSNVPYDSLATALGITPTVIANANTGGMLSTSNSYTYDPNVPFTYTAIQNNTNCPTCGEFYFSHPRMGISHACNTANIPFNNNSSNVSTTLTVSNTPLINATPVVASAHPVDHLNRDTQFSRENLYDVVTEASGAIANLSALAGESQQPRAYEVLGQLLKIKSEEIGRAHV